MKFSLAFIRYVSLYRVFCHALTSYDPPFLHSIKLVRVQDFMTSRCVFTTRLRTGISLPLLAIIQLSQAITLSGGIFVRLKFVAIVRSPHFSHEVGISDTFVVRTKA